MPKGRTGTDVVDLEPHIPGGIFERAPAVGHFVEEYEVPTGPLLLR
jgi:hypothetical protein